MNGAIHLVVVHMESLYWKKE